MALPWEGIVQTTIANYLRTVSDNTVRFQQFLAMLQSKGNIKYKMGGTRVEWKVQFKQKLMTTFTDGQTPTFDRLSRYQSPTLDWRAYQLPDSVTKMETLANQGPQAIVDIFSGKVELLTKEMRQQFGNQLYIDGNAAGNTDKIHGLNSAFSVSGAQPNGYVGINDDTYAGLNTALGDKGGSWDQSAGNTIWPRGAGSVEYDYWTPIVALYDNAAWGSTPTWANVCEEVLSFCIVHTHRNGGREGMIDLFMLDRELYRQFLAFQRARQRYDRPYNDKGGLQGMGFPGIIYHDGVEVTQEFDVPTGTGFGLNFDEIELMCQDDSLFKGEGPVWSTPHQAYLFFLGFYGNMRFNPRNQSKLRTTAG